MEAKTTSTKPLVALVGKTNVGKSSLLNALAGQRLAVVHESPNVTRDRVFANLREGGKEFILVDTGGLGAPRTKLDPMLRKVSEQAKLAIREAQLIVFVIDGQAGISAPDYEIANLLRRSGKPILFVANKMESEKKAAGDLYDLRLGEALSVSAKSGLNIKLVLGKIAAALPAYEPALSEDGESPRIAIVGRQNVGKSSLVNALLGEEKQLVNEQPGTTRDAVDSETTFNGKRITLVDTAGIRQQKKLNEAVEFYSTLRSFRAIDQANVVIVVLSGNEGITVQDQRIAGYAHNAGRAIVLAVNKWDLVAGKENGQTSRQGRGAYWDCFAPLAMTSGV